MKTRSTTMFNIFVRILLIAILLASIAVVLPVIPARADDAVWALQFDGATDWVHLGTTAEIMGTGWETTKSVNLWLKPSSGRDCVTSDAASCDVIFSDLPKFWGITIGRITYGHHANQDCIWVWNFDNPMSGEDLICVPYTPGEWVNIALVHSDGMLRAFKNGVQRGSVVSGATHHLPGVSDLYLGGILYKTGDVMAYSGQIDEVRIWNRALTDIEIRDTMFNDLALPQTGLMAYYKMSDGPPHVTLTDDSGNGRNGTLLDGKPDNDPPGDGQFAQWVPSDAFVVPDVPIAPSGFTTTPVSAFQINLSWTDSSDNETDFEIHRCIGHACSNFSLLTFVQAGAGTGSRIDYYDTSASPRTEYCYHVHAINSGGTSPPTVNSCNRTWNILFLPAVVR